MTFQPFLIPLKKNSISKFKDILPKTDKILVFDIDDTLYCQSTGLDKKMSSNIYEFVKNCGVHQKDVPEVCRGYNERYGLTIKGIFKNFPDLVVSDLIDKILSGIKITDFLSPDDELIELLSKSKYVIYCFTNACYQHAINVLDALSLTKFVTGIFYCEYVPSGDFVCKPEREAYDIVESLLHESSIYFWDDNMKNVVAAEKHGWYSQIVTVKENIKSRLVNFYAEDIEMVEVGKDAIIDEITKRFVSDVNLEEEEEMKENKLKDK